MTKRSAHPKRTRDSEPLYHSYTGAGDTWAMDELFEFNSGVYVSDISIGVMEKYAILVGGGSTDASANFDAFENDLFEMYDTLKTTYDDWKDENIYCYLWDKTNAYNLRVDGQDTQLNIYAGLEEIALRITEDDFFYFFEFSHGEVKTGNGEFITFPAVDTSYGQFSQWLAQTVMNRWARSLFVFASCHSGHGISEIEEFGPLKNSIVISATRADEVGYVWVSGEHFRFFYTEGYGFLHSLKEGTSSISSAYESGHVAANYYSPIRCSHPLLDDNSDGIGHENGDMGTDGDLAEYTWM